MILLKSNPPLGFILSLKTGSRSIESALLSTGLAERRLGHSRICEDTIREVHAAGGRVYATVRNPFDTAVSWYHHRLLDVGANEPAWPQWLRKFVDEGVPPFIESGDSLFPGRKFMDAPIQYEYGIEFVLCAILDRVGLGPVRLEHIGKSADRRPMSEYWTPELQELFVDRFREDFDVLGYSTHGTI